MNNISEKKNIVLHFCMSLISALIEDTWISHLLLHLICCNLLLCLQYVKKIQASTDVWEFSWIYNWKREEYLFSLFR